MIGYTQDGALFTMTAEHEAWLDSRDMCICGLIQEPDVAGTYTCPENDTHYTLTWTRKGNKRGSGI